MTEPGLGSGALRELPAKWRAEVEKCCPILLSDPKSNVTDASCRQQMRDAAELETALSLSSPIEPPPHASEVRERMQDIQARLREGHKGNTEVEQYYTADVQWLVDRLAPSRQGSAKRVEG